MDGNNRKITHSKSKEKQENKEKGTGVGEVETSVRHWCETCRLEESNARLYNRRADVDDVLHGALVVPWGEKDATRF